MSYNRVMIVGPSGSGKSTAWQVLLEALERVDGVEGVSHVIDPKGISKEALYGVLDPNTREWTDGLFTHILRKIIDNVRGELSISYNEADMDTLRYEIKNVCGKRNLTYGVGVDDCGSDWVQKVLQVYQISQIHHGLMMVII